MKVKFDLFQRQKQMLQSLSAREVDKKHGVVWLVCSILLGIRVLQMSKLVCFSEFLCPQQRKVWSAIFYNASERSLCALLVLDQLLWRYWLFSEIFVMSAFFKYLNRFARCIMNETKNIAFNTLIRQIYNSAHSM